MRHRHSLGRLIANVLLAITLTGCSQAAVESFLSTPTPTVAPTVTPSATPTLAPTPSLIPTSAPPTSAPTPTSPAVTPSPSMSAAEEWDALAEWFCGRVEHTAWEEFVSYIQFGVGLNDWFGRDASEVVDYIEILVSDTNDDEYEVLEYDAEYGFWLGYLGLHSAGSKTIVSVLVHWADGHVSDATEAFIEDLGSDTIDVRYPQEDEFGDCGQMPDLPPA